MAEERQVHLGELWERWPQTTLLSWTSPLLAELREQPGELTGFQAIRPAACAARLLAQLGYYWISQSGAVQLGERQAEAYLPRGRFGRMDAC